MNPDLGWALKSSFDRDFLQRRVTNFYCYDIEYIVCLDAGDLLLEEPLGKSLLQWTVDCWCFLSLHSRLERAEK